MTDLRPTTKAERDEIVKQYTLSTGDVLASREVRLIADLDRRDDVLRRLVEWYGPPKFPDLEAESIIADARALLEERQ